MVVHGFRSYATNRQPAPTPEVSTWSALLLGFGGIALLGWKRRRPNRLASLI
jgi:hypothetical protein